MTHSYCIFLHRTLALAALTLLAAAAAAAPPNTALDFSPCELTGSAGNGRASAECARWLRPLDPSDPSAGNIELFVARIASTAPKPAADALTLINGGPGAASTELYVDMAALFDSVQRERDIILLDQRGTGRSSPLRCAAAAEELAYETSEAMREYGKQCLNDLDFAPQTFTTSVAVQDLEALRAALGYEQLNLYGVSYGTRVAQHYARRFPDRVRTLVIDGVLPPALGMGPMVPINAQRAFNSILTRCAQNAGCASAFPNLAADFLRLGQQLRDEPVTVTVPDPNTGKPRTLELGYGHLAIAVRLMSYATETTALVPVMINEAANAKNYLPLATQAIQMESQLGDTMSYGMHFAVVCTEDVPFIKQDPAQDELIAASYLGQDQVDGLRHVCHDWPQGVIDEDLKSAWQTNLPTLVLSGEVDPITVHDYGTEVAAGMTQAQHVIVPGQGHGVLSRGCVPNLFSKFIDTADAQALDTSCIKRLGPEPFFVDLMGPAR